MTRDEWEQYLRERYGDNNVIIGKRDFFGAGGGRNAGDNRNIIMKANIQIDKDGTPIPLRRQTVNGLDIPLPDPTKEGKPHIVNGGKISSKIGELYLQMAIFDGGENWRTVNGHPVPRAEVHWTDHRRAIDHDNPHQHIFYYDVKQKKWMKSDAAYY